MICVCVGVFFFAEDLEDSQSADYLWGTVGCSRPNRDNLDPVRYFLFFVSSFCISFLIVIGFSLLLKAIYHGMSNSYWIH